jgi:hypothetical protein
MLAGKMCQRVNGDQQFTFKLGRDWTGGGDLHVASNHRDAVEGMRPVISSNACLVNRWMSAYVLFENMDTGPYVLRKT